MGESLNNVCGKFIQIYKLFLLFNLQYQQKYKYPTFGILFERNLKENYCISLICVHIEILS